MTALEVQISEFRAEVRAEFSATRTELRQEMRTLNDTARAGDAGAPALETDYRAAAAETVTVTSFAATRIPSSA